MATDIVKLLSERLGAEQIVGANVIAERATSYWNQAPMRAKALVLPRNTEEVATVLRTCLQARQPLVTQGGLTNCVAAAEPTDNEIILSLDKMNRVVEVDTIESIAIVEAGAVLQNV